MQNKSMKVLINKLKAITEINEDDIWFKFLRNNEEGILNLNRYDQLFNEGINSDGVNLDNIGGAYTEGYAAYKRSLGLPDDRNTLYINGYFYSLFQLIASKEGFKITASDSIELVRDIKEQFGADVLGLTNESKSKLSIILAKDIREFIIKIWQES